jgi:hypothetical protein
VNYHLIHHARYICWRLHVSYYVHGLSFDYKLPYNPQIPTVLKEYGMTSVTEGIDAIATTRVLITRDVTGDEHSASGYSSRSFRYSPINNLSLSEGFLSIFLVPTIYCFAFLFDSLQTNLCVCSLQWERCSYGRCCVQCSSLPECPEQDVQFYWCSKCQQRSTGKHKCEALRMSVDIPFLYLISEQGGRPGEKCLKSCIPCY